MLKDEILARKKEGKVMIVSVEGLSCAGKSTLCRELGYDDECVKILECDKFFAGREKATKMFDEMFSGVRDKGDYPSKFWDYEKMQSVIDSVIEFNESDDDDDEKEFLLKDVLSEKKDGTEHDETLVLCKDDILLVAGVMVRHLNGIDLCVKIETDPDECIQRKILRRKEKGIGRSAEEAIRQMKEVEIPAMKKFDDEQRKPDIIIK